MNIGRIYHDFGNGSIIPERAFLDDKSEKKYNERFEKIENPTKEDFNEALDFVNGDIKSLENILQIMKDLPNVSEKIGSYESHQRLLGVVELEKKVLEVKIAMS